MRKAFTMVEMLITVVILGILATTAIAGYQGMMAKSMLNTDKTNILMLLQATKTYYLENDKSPASLAALPQKYYDRAYAQVLNTPMKRFSYELALKQQNAGVAYAAQTAGSNYCQSGSLCSVASKYGLKPSTFQSAKNPSVKFAYTSAFTGLPTGTLWQDIPGGMLIVRQSALPNKIGKDYIGVAAAKDGVAIMTGTSETSAPKTIMLGTTEGGTNNCRKVSDQKLADPCRQSYRQ